MTTSLVPEDCLTTSSDTVTMTTGFIAQDIASLGNITVSNSTGSSYYYTGAGIGGSSSTISISPSMTITSSGGIGIGTINSISISGAGSSTFNWKAPEEFVDTLPDFNRIQKMCEQYPGFKIAFEKFKTTYYLVKNDYDTPEDQRPLP